MTRTYTCRRCPPGTLHEAQPRGRLPSVCPTHKRDHALLWEGPSAFTGAPVLVLVTTLTPETQNRNHKLGSMGQVWIVPRDTAPKLAVRNGDDEAVCGDCPQRWSTGGGCYVHWRWGPQQVWYAHHHIAPRTAPNEGQLYGARLRISSWGDPAAVPLSVWRGLLPQLANWTAYTHQWRKLTVDQWGWCMASADTIEAKIEATERGWRTFRVRPPGTLLGHDEVDCPGAKGRATCAQCGLCCGSLLAKNVSIETHGNMAGRFKRDLPMARLLGLEAA